MGLAHKPGDFPGGGTFVCMNCGWTFEASETDPLPFCEVCGIRPDTRYLHTHEDPTPAREVPTRERRRSS